MKKNRWSLVLMSIVAAGILVFAGCSDNTDNGPGPGPTTPPLVGTWNATPVSAQQLGVDELKYFLRTDSTYLWYKRAGSTEIRENGTWRSTSDSITFHETSLDSVAQDRTYRVWYRLSANEDTLTTHLLLDQLYTITYIRQ